MKSWILLTNIHHSNTFIEPEGDRFDYTISPDPKLKKGDIVYLWWNPDSYFYGWGIVAETPRDFVQEDNEFLPRRKRPRQNVVVDRKKELDPRITRQMMQSDRILKRMIPTGFDDLQVVPLRPEQANYLNDYIRINKLDAPQGSVMTKLTIPHNAPNITIQAVVTFDDKVILKLGDKVDYGSLVEGVRFPWYHILKMINDDPEEIYRIDERAWEELIAGAYEREGYKVTLTPRSGDYGRDVIAVKDGMHSIRIIDQVKRNRIHNPVDANDVRALMGVLSGERNTSKGVITTTSTFAPRLEDDPFIKPFIPYRLELKPRDLLLPWLEGLRTGKKLIIP